MFESCCNKTTYEVVSYIVAASDVIFGISSLWSARASGITGGLVLMVLGAVLIFGLLKNKKKCVLGVLITKVFAFVIFAIIFLIVLEEDIEVLPARALVTICIVIAFYVGMLGIVCLQYREMSRADEKGPLQETTNIDQLHLNENMYEDCCTKICCFKAISYIFGAYNIFLGIVSIWALKTSSSSAIKSGLSLVTLGILLLIGLIKNIKNFVLGFAITEGSLFTIVLINDFFFDESPEDGFVVFIVVHLVFVGIVYLYYREMKKVNKIELVEEIRSFDQL